MSRWHMGRMAAFDLETTSPDPTTARIVTACFALVGGGEATDVREWLVDPGVDIPEEAAAIHGVTTERARSEGQDPGSAITEITAALTNAWDLGIPVVAFNAAYDLTVLDRELERHTGGALAIAGAVVDPYVIDRKVDAYRKGPRTLAAQAAHYRVALDGAHNSTADAVCAARVAWRIGCKFPDVAALDLPELHAAQVAWHAERQADFAAYLRRMSKPADDVNGEWPLRSRSRCEVSQ